MGRLAVCLLSCGREDLTRRTVESFMAHNGHLIAITKLHADDESTPENLRIGQGAGFQTVHAPTGRMGLMAGLRALVLAAERSGCDRILWLENDWEWTRSLADTPALGHHGLECIRLYGVEKQADGQRPAGTRNMVTGLPIIWQSVTPEWSSALAHFGGAPSIILLDKVRPHIRAETMKDMACAMGSIATIRPRVNYVWHLGRETTPGFKH